MGFTEILLIGILIAIMSGNYIRNNRFTRTEIQKIKLLEKIEEQLFRLEKIDEKLDRLENINDIANDYRRY